MTHEPSGTAKRRSIGRRLVVAALAVLALVILAALFVAPRAEVGPGHLNACKTEGRTLLVAVEAYAEETGRYPTSVDDLLVDTKIGKVQGPFLEDRPTFCAIADNGHGTVVVRDGVKLPSNCRGWHPRQLPHR